MAEQTPLRVRIDGEETVLLKAAVLGRADDADIRCSDKRVSRQHARFIPTPDGWSIEDLASANGTFVNGQRIKDFRVTGPAVLRLADPDGGVLLEVEPVVPDPVVPEPVVEEPLVAEPLGDDPVETVAMVTTSVAVAAPNIEPTTSIRVKFDGREFTFTGRDPLTIGRNEQSTLQSADKRVSRIHARLQQEGDTWVLTDLGSSNGTYIEGRRVTRVDIRVAVMVRLGDPREGVPLELEPTEPPLDATALRQAADESTDGDKTAIIGALSAVHEVGKTVRIGRAGDNDVVLGDLSVSRHHAELHVDQGRGYQLIDLGAVNGTFLNGRRVQEAYPVEGDLIGIGRETFHLVAGQLEQYQDIGAVAFSASGLTVHAAKTDNLLLDDITFALPENALLAAVGPSGAGKTTLLGALTGLRPAQEGHVFYGGRDLYSSYDELRQRIGYVPQEDILHSQLTTRTALNYAAELRFGPDVSKAEREHRVAEVMSELGLSERAGLQIEKLSGGQRKRVSIAVELITRPSLLFLDEPTSGLDPGMEKHLMALLRELADGGRTVIVVTHSVASLHLCDRLLFLAPGGRSAFFGPPDRALGFFDKPEYADVFTDLEEKRGHDWKGVYRASALFKMYIGDLAGLRPSGAGADNVPINAPPRRGGLLRQFSILTRRYVSVTVSDRVNSILLAIQAPILALIVLLAIAPNGFNVHELHAQRAAVQCGLFLVISATYLGAGNAIREIVKELPIYTRERSIGQSIAAYLGSKVVVLSVITVLQAVVLVLVGAARQGGSDPGTLLPSLRLELVLDIALAGLAAMALGLFISALVSRADKALTLLPLLLVPQLVLSFPQLQIETKPVLSQLSYFASAQWGYAAMASSIDLNRLAYLDARTIDPRINGDPENATAALVQSVKTASVTGMRKRWRHVPLYWALDCGALVVLFVISIAGAAVGLRRRDPKARRS
jgi:ABC-type multidrug transport system ATPase subunit/pSer/pThr/pTyr-binding forkhead associated (FHA) protein